VPAVPQHQRDKFVTVEIAQPAPLSPPTRQEKPMSIVGESRALSRNAAKAKIMAFVETLSDREPQREQPRKRTMSDGERAKSLAKYHARMGRHDTGAVGRVSAAQERSPAEAYGS